jgi:hypothetical protein
MASLGLVRFTKRLFVAGGISVRGLFLLPVYYIQLIAAIPFGIIQSLIFGRRIAKTDIARDPVFILGHYRSGTTYLQKLLGSNTDFGYLTNYDTLFANTNLLFGNKMKGVFQKIIHVFRIKNPFFNTFSADLSDPAEEDDFLMNKASAYTPYWGFVFPIKSQEWLNESNHFRDPQFLRGWKKDYLDTLKYATFKNLGKRLILKNPPSTGRIRILLELFPSAKFIFIYRNPYNVYYSTRNMWKKAILPYYSLQKISDQELDEIIFSHYNYLMEAYEVQKYLIPEGNLIEIAYEELISDPYAGIQKIAAHLNLAGFGSSVDHLRQTIQREMSYQNNRYTYSSDVLMKIKEHWGRFIHQRNYNQPEG